LNFTRYMALNLPFVSSHERSHLRFPIHANLHRIARVGEFVVIPCDSFKAGCDSRPGNSGTPAKPRGAAGARVPQKRKSRRRVPQEKSLNDRRLIAMHGNV